MLFHAKRKSCKISSNIFGKLASLLTRNGMISKIQYEFSATPWQHGASGGWHFISLPVEISKEIREHLKFQEEGWGRMKASVQIGKTSWETAIWFDTKQNTYLLPLKAAIRKKEKVELGVEIQVIVWI